MSRCSLRQVITIKFIAYGLLVLHLLGNTAIGWDGIRSRVNLAIEHSSIVPGQFFCVCATDAISLVT